MHLLSCLGATFSSTIVVCSAGFSVFSSFTSDAFLELFLEGTSSSFSDCLRELFFELTISSSFSEALRELFLEADFSCSSDSLATPPSLCPLRRSRDLASSSCCSSVACFGIHRQSQDLPRCRRIPMTESLWEGRSRPPCCCSQTGSTPPVLASLASWGCWRGLPATDLGP